jgi:predicted  nucleic acid-binding Zn-ribbon protein
MRKITAEKLKEIEKKEARLQAEREAVLREAKDEEERFKQLESMVDNHSPFKKPSDLVVALVEHYNLKPGALFKIADSDKRGRKKIVHMTAQLRDKVKKIDKARDYDNIEDLARRCGVSPAQAKGTLEGKYDHL